jgi:glycosyltransferase involved in cell wall biosynthesis
MHICILSLERRNGNSTIKILIVSDYSPAIAGGAQLVVELLREAGIRSGHDLTSVTYKSKLSSRKISRLTNIKFIQYARELFNPFGVIRILYYQILNKPDMIWYHNINNEWSWSVLRFNLFKSKQVITLHDLSPISRRKLTPNDLVNVKNSNFQFGRFKKLRNTLIRLLLKDILAVGIGKKCSLLLVQNQIVLKATIPNRILPCGHTDVSEKIKNSVFFAGRENLKGLAEIARAVNSSTDWKLYLAGDEILKKFALSYCPKEKIIWLGKLTNAEVQKEIHSMELVAVCSQYFDNYPTIALEALVHGSIPITSDVTGVSELIMEVSPLLVLRVGELPNLDNIREYLDSKPTIPREILDSITDVDYQFRQYMDLF